MAVGPFDPVASCVTGGATVAMRRRVAGVCRHCGHAVRLEAWVLSLENDLEAIDMAREGTVQRPKLFE